MLRPLILLLSLLLTPSLAQARGIEPELVAEGPVQAGGQVELAIHMRTNPGWHGYWLNPGDAGLPMTLEWQLPEGTSLGPLRYPVPGRLLIAGLMNYVYDRDYAVLVRLKAPVNAQGIIPLRANASWLACTDKICVPESGELALDLPVGRGGRTSTSFDAWRKQLPQPLATPARFEIRGRLLRVAVPLPARVAVGDAYVFPVVDGAVDYAGKQTFGRSGDTLIAELPLGRAAPQKFDGILALSDGRGLEFHARRGTVPDAEPLAAKASGRMLLLAVLGALAGGVLLNLMPCVFPILALKALHLARGGGAEREARRDALAYALGAVVGTGALGIALLAIRAGGAAAGWAFQLQDPRSLLILLLLTVAITLNLLGLFALPVLGGRAQPAGGLGTGLLAAFVATPCAGPFMGAALGATLVLPLAGSVLVFATLGLGLAAPFVIVAFVPGLRERLPKPGSWMVKLQRFLAIPMAATAVACLWILSRQAGGRGALVGATAVGLLTLLFFGLCFAQRKGKSLGWAVCGSALLIAGGAIVALPAGQTAARTPIGAEPWSESKARRYLADGNAVFVYFTADWCLTCKANEVAAIDRTEVRSAFREARVKVLVGDWTNGDPAITRFLESRGRAGVPLYLWYAAEGPPEELPQILNPGLLVRRAQATP